MEHIQKIIYINLDKRADRREQIEREFARMNLTATRFPAIECTPGNVGCFKSHLAVLKQAREENLENVLIMEDDFKFIVKKQTFERNMADFFNLNIPYDVLMLSYNLAGSEPYNGIVSYARKAYTASGYIVHRRFYDTLINLYEETLPQLIETNRGELYVNDVVWQRLQPQSQWFYFNRRIGKQRPSYSDIELRNVNYCV